MNRLRALEKLYPEIPPQVLLKADLVFTGIQVNASLVNAGSSSTPHFRTVLFENERRAIPYFIRVPDGGAEGGELLVLVRPDPASPYHMEDDADGRRWLWDGASVLGPIRPDPKPAWHAWAEQHGFRRATTGMNQHGDMLVANLTPACDYWSASPDEPNDRCLFCGYGAVSERSQHLNQRRGVASVAPETLDEFRNVLPLSRGESKHLYLVGGSMRNRDAEGERYEQIARAAVAAEPGYRGAIGCGSQALSKSWCRKIREAGAGYACFNLEVWDPELWRKICPGKAKYVGYDDWLRSMTDAVEVFGRGGVFSAFVAGVELLPPLGMATQEEAIESNAAGTDWLLQRGIVPIHSPFSPTALSAQGQGSGPTLDYFLKLNLATARLRRKHRMPVDTRFICGGCTYAQLECDLDRLG
jgi:hypothetical protein